MAGLQEIVDRRGRIAEVLNRKRPLDRDHPWPARVVSREYAGPPELKGRRLTFWRADRCRSAFRKYSTRSNSLEPAASASIRPFFAGERARSIGAPNLPNWTS